MAPFPVLASCPSRSGFGPVSVVITWPLLRTGEGRVSAKQGTVATWPP